MIVSTEFGHAALQQVQAKFLSIVPKIRLYARIYFRHVKCSFKKADFIAEVIALSWKWFVRLAKRGKDACCFPSVLAGYAAKAVHSGRRITGQLKPRDVMSERAQQKHGFVVGEFPDFSTLDANPLSEVLAENTVSPVPDQVQFRLDFPAWTKSRSRRDRQLILDMASGERTQELAKRFQISEGRVSQLRRDFHEDYERFTS